MTGVICYVDMFT